MCYVLNNPDTSFNIPDHLPFLESICWQKKDVRQFSLMEMLQHYESGWKYRGVLADLEGDELYFVRHLVKKFDSWIVNDV